MKKITEDILRSLSSQAIGSTRKRTNYNFHTFAADPLQRMLNALEPDSYVQPHKHENPDKREAFVILKGTVAVFTFNEQGSVTDYIQLNYEKGNYGVEISPGIWHTIVAMEPYSVLYELKDGPYQSAADKVFADWAPEEGTEEGYQYLVSLKKQLNH